MMYILYNEDPLWMSLCRKGASGSWKKTALHKYVSPHMQLLVLKLNYSPFLVHDFSFYLMLTYLELGILNAVRLCQTNTKEYHRGPLYFDGKIPNTKCLLSISSIFLGKFRHYALRKP